MAQIIRPVYFKPQMIVGMNHLMRHGILQMTLILHLVCTHENAVLRVESSGLSVRAPAAVDIVTVEIAA
jgi:hypothetical protein